jgi:hypothetical protein
MIDIGAWQEGGWLWLVIDVLAVVILGSALFYASRTWRNRPRNPVVERESDEATRRLYNSDTRNEHTSQKGPNVSH